ncbi:hypothetical protein BKA62DRAFT_772831 [Auriculariales sp. MPI-PUGE-AT-0066]|nr:hypothetical protein BKA62DRAFT_772831 [Auriculariales sp. MPI-PUGE-AT-0066]
MNSLPDELLSIILAPWFTVPEQLFADNQLSSPFSKVPQSAAGLLHVCKRWMRATTPLLYETVIIRSKAQASSLNLALTGHSEFGRFTRRLRLEGAYGEWVTPEIIQAMPHVKQFCFTLSVLYKDEVSGLQTAFELFQPERVILTLHNPYGKGNQKQRQLTRDLANCIPLWIDLKHFTFSVPNDAFAFNTLTPGLLLAPKLKTVTAYFRVAYGPENSRNITFKASTQLLAKPGLGHFIMQGLNGGCGLTERLSFLRQFAPELRQRIHSASISSTAVDFAKPVQSKPIVQPFWYPLQGQSEEERLAIWTQIFAFAFNPNGSSKSLQQLMASMRTLFRKISLDPTLYRQLEVATLRDPCIPNIVEHLQLNIYRHISNENFPNDQQLHDTIARMTNVQELLIRSGITHSLERVWPVLRVAAGGTLVRLSFQVNWSIRNDQLIKFPSQDVLGGLTVLQELYWDAGPLILTIDEDDGPLSHSLVKLRRLEIQTAHSTFFSALNRFELPSLETLTVNGFHKDIDALFLQVHGQKLTRINVGGKIVSQALLNAVPNLRCLHISVEGAAKMFLGLKHASISRIQYNFYHYDTRKFRQACEYLKQGVEDGQFPALRDILISSEMWPNNEQEAGQEKPMATVIEITGHR